MKISIKGLIILSLLLVEFVTGVILTAAYRPEVFFSSYTLAAFLGLTTATIVCGILLTRQLAGPIQELRDLMKNCGHGLQVAEDGRHFVIELEDLGHSVAQLCQRLQTAGLEKAQVYDERRFQERKVRDENEALRGTLATLEARIQQADQEIREAHREKHHFQDKLHEVISTISSENVTIQEKIEQHRVQLESVLSSIHSFPDAFVVLDPENRVIFSNKAAADLLETTIAALQDRTFFFPVASGQKSEVELQSRLGHSRIAEVFAVESSWQGQKAFLVSMRDITDRKETARSLSESNARLQAIIHTLELRDEQLRSITTMAKFFQLCSTEKEVRAVISDNLGRLFPVKGGSVYILDEDINVFARIHEWGGQQDVAAFFTPDQCWALKTGQSHSTLPGRSNLFCHHINDGAPPENDGLCVPIANNEAQIGLIFLEFEGRPDRQGAPPHDSFSHDSIKELCSTTADHIALAITNIRLQEKLRESAVRDSLTGLYNRRHTLDFLKKQFYIAQHGGKPISVILLDVDHFKKFNDTFGHDAGDFVLKMTGALLQHSVRKGEVASRYGGEEFLLVFPDTPMDSATRMAEEIRQKVESNRFQYEDLSLGTVTLSLGVACFPLHGQTEEDVIKAADNALYQAKRDGRNRVVAAMLPEGTG